MNDSLTSKFIEISGVEQTFKTRKGMFPALRDIHLTVAKGEFVALIGHSGCGKSTLLNLIAGLTTPTKTSRISKINNSRQYHCASSWSPTRRSSPSPTRPSSSRSWRPT